MISVLAKYLLTCAAITGTGIYLSLANVGNNDIHIRIWFTSIRSGLFGMECCSFTAGHGTKTFVGLIEKDYTLFKTIICIFYLWYGVGGTYNSTTHRSTLT